MLELMPRQAKLECLPLEIIFQPSLLFAAEAENLAHATGVGSSVKLGWK